MAITEQRRLYNQRWVESNRDHVKAYRDANKDKRNARRRELYAQEKDRRAQAIEGTRQYRINNPFARRAATYGIPAEKLEVMSIKGCAICGATEGKLHVDHDHKSGRVRGILCSACNLAIGHLQDDPIIVASALRYLMNGGNVNA